MKIVKIILSNGKELRFKAHHTNTNDDKRCVELFDDKEPYDRTYPFIGQFNLDNIVGFYINEI